VRKISENRKILFRIRPEMRNNPMVFSSFFILQQNYGKFAKGGAGSIIMPRRVVSVLSPEHVVPRS
jgi:hypothetical protein